MILLIDNYDSFSYNLYQLIGEIEPDVKVVRNDEISVDEIRRLKPERIILSPGPGRPEDAGILIEVVKELGKEIPILGVCLGHQAVCAAFGAKNYLCKKANARKAVSDKSRYRNVVVFRLLTEHFGCKISFSCGRRRHDSGQSLCYRLHKRRRNHGDTA